MTSNLLCPNPSKAELYIYIVGLREQLKTHLFFNLDSASTRTFTPNSPVRNLGGIFDQNIVFSDHITHLSRSCFMHIRDLRGIHPMLDLKPASTISGVFRGGGHGAMSTPFRSTINFFSM